MENYKYLKLKYMLSQLLFLYCLKISTAAEERKWRSSALRSQSGPIHPVFPADNAQLVKLTYFLEACHKRCTYNSSSGILYCRLHC